MAKLGKRAKEVWSLLKEIGEGISEDNAARLAAALAFYTLLSLSPLIVLAVAFAGLAFGGEAARGQISNELGSVVGPEGASVIETVVKNAKDPGSGIAGSIIGVAVLLFGASGVFGELQSALNAIWRVKPKPGRGFVGIVRDRLASFAMVMGVAFLLLVSLLMSAGLATVGRFLSSSLPGGEPVWQVINFILSLVVVTALFAATFKTVPDARVAWRDVWVGAASTALMFTLGKILIGLYLGKSGVSSAYGAAGSLVALTVWVYYSSIILLIGAEFTRVYAQRYGTHIRPDNDAVAVEPEPQSPEEKTRADEARQSRDPQKSPAHA